MIYDDTVRSAARVRLDLTLERLRELGIPAHGEVMDPDPYLATQDAMREWGADEIIVSTYPYPRSGVLRRDLIERIEKWSGLPVEHVRRGPPRGAGAPRARRRQPDVGGPELIESLERRATVVPAPLHRDRAPERRRRRAAAAQERLEQTLAELRQAGLKVNGYVDAPRPADQHPQRASRSTPRTRS